MSKLVKYGLIALLLIIAIGVAWYSGFKYSFAKKHVEEDKELVLDRVKKVTKLVAVEGYFSEMYSYEDYKYYNISLLRKKMIMRIKAKVSVGFDFDSLNIEIKENPHQIIITDFPEPTVIAVDHDVDYYDIDEGTFNSFTEKDYNNLQKKAKDFIAQKAMDSSLRESAIERKQELQEMMKYICKSMGWELSFIESPILKD